MRTIERWLRLRRRARTPQSERMFVGAPFDDITGTFTAAVEPTAEGSRLPSSTIWLSCLGCSAV